VGEEVVHGWITVLEKESQAGWDVQPAVAAYFAAEPHYRRSIPQQAPQFLQEASSQGSCTLYKEALPSPLFLDPCQPPCPADQYCSGDTCVDLPRHYDVGTLTLEGLKSAQSMTPDEVDRYALETPPADLFDMGDPVTALTAGGELDPLTIQATGVAPFQAASDTLALSAGTAATYTWTPADPASRVLLVLRGGLHDPSLPVAAILCDAPDGAGQVEIAAALVDEFRASAFVIQKASVALRYTRQVIKPYQGDIELIVGSQRPVLLELP
jgi:hypothetical protein